MFIIGFAGKAGAGKDTAAAGLTDYRKYALAYPIKAMLGALGLHPEDFATIEQKEAVVPWIGVTYRRLAQTLGTEWGRECITSDLWLRCMAHYIDEMGQAGLKRLAITDVRFPNEAEAIRAQGGTIFHILRPGAQTTAEKSHASEAGVPITSTDVVIANTGSVEDLHAQVVSAAQRFEGRQYG